MAMKQKSKGKKNPRETIESLTEKSSEKNFGENSKWCESSTAGYVVVWVWLWKIGFSQPRQKHGPLAFKQL